MQVSMNRIESPVELHELPETSRKAATTGSQRAQLKMCLGTQVGSMGISLE